MTFQTYFQISLGGGGGGGDGGGGGGSGGVDIKIWIAYQSNSIQAMRLIARPYSRNKCTNMNINSHGNSCAK